MFTSVVVSLWHVSKVSIIFDCSMLFYYLFWMFMGFIKHFYITFGTNLLTQSPVPAPVFSLVSVFRGKGISNRVQTEWNLRESYFWNGSNPGDLEWTSGKLRGGHEGQGRAYPLGTPPYLMAASLLPWRPHQVSWIAFVSRTTLPKVSFRLDSVWYSFSAKHWNTQKTAICNGPWVNRLVQKII